MVDQGLCHCHIHMFSCTISQPTTRWRILNHVSRNQKMVYGIWSSIPCHANPHNGYVNLFERINDHLPVWGYNPTCHERFACPILLTGKITKLQKITMFNGKIRYKWPFSIAMLNYQRVSEAIILLSRVKPYFQWLNPAFDNGA